MTPLGAVITLRASLAAMRSTWRAISKIEVEAVKTLVEDHEHRLATQGWRPISEARKDRTRYLLKLRPASEFPDHAKRWGSEVFVGLHSGLAEDGFDIGWSVSSPVGTGGFPDSWIEGYQEIAGVTELGPWEPWKVNGDD